MSYAFFACAAVEFGTEHGRGVVRVDGTAGARAAIGVMWLCMGGQAERVHTHTQTYFHKHKHTHTHRSGVALQQKMLDLHTHIHTIVTDTNTRWAAGANVPLRVPA